MIAFLRTSLTYAELAAGFGISGSACWRSIAEGISVLASELRCRPERCTAVVRAVLALHYMEHGPFAALRAA